MKRSLLHKFMVILMAGLVSCSSSDQTERLFEHFLNRHIERIKPIHKKYNEAVWATYSGKSSFSDLLQESRLTDSLYKVAGEPVEYYQNLLNNVYDNTTDFEILMKIKKSGLITDSLLKRQFVKVFREYVSIQNNWEESESRKAKLFEQFFELKKNDAAFWDSIMVTKNSNARNEWINRYAKLTEDYRNMIKAMNSDAENLGYQNYYQMLMDFNSVDYSSIDEMISIIERETSSDYQQLLAISQKEICRQFEITPDEIGNKHYNYSVRQMMVPENWNKKFTREEVVKIVQDFFAFGEFDISSIWKNSDIWYDEKKIDQSFFFCPDVDQKEYRIYADIKPSTFGIYTLLHEIGHAVHYNNVDANIPYLLKEPHVISTEAVAIYFNDKIYHSPVLRSMMGLPESPGSIYYEAFSDPMRLVFLRKMLRNIQFEKQIFENPNQNFNELWWNLNEKYLLYSTCKEERIPEWISNQHIVNASGGYLFYLFAFAISAQLEAYFPDDIIGPLKGFMRYGDAMPWNDLLKQATGEELNLSYLFNSYKWKSGPNVPITLDFKEKGNLSYHEQIIFDDLFSKNIYTFI